MRIRDISPHWFWLPFGLIIAMVMAHYLLPGETYQYYVAEREYGIVEWMQPILLVPGIVFGALALRFWPQLPTATARGWILLVTLGAFYMMGEEISWGQWIFMWDTPDVMLEINKQHETNLHNSSSWFNQKPRLLLELWVLFGTIRSGMRAYKHLSDDNGTTAYWFWPTRPLAWTGVLAMLAMMPERVTDWWGVTPPFPFDIDAAEAQELVLAAYLSMFLASALVRLKSLQRIF
jgi:hypothetical protein